MAQHRKDDIGAEAVRMTQQGASKAAELGRQQGEQMGRAFQASASALGDLADLSCGDLAKVANTQARLTQAMQEMGWEFMRFAQDSMRTSLRTANDIAHCRSVEDIASLQRDFMRETMEQWMEGSARLLRIGSDAASEAVDELESGAEEQQGRSRRRSGGEESRAT